MRSKAIILFICSIALASAKNEGIVIVGAGAAGYSAAAKLLENGHESVLILEAEDRIGGRIYSVPHENGFIDLGAQWCHGEKGNAIFELVDKHYHFGRSEYFENPIDCQFSSGQSANQEDCVKLQELLLGIYQSSEDARNISLGHFVEKEYDKTTTSAEYERIDPKLIKLMKPFFSKQMAGYYAADSWFDISAYYNIYTQECEGSQELNWRTDGFKTVFEFISKRLPNPNEGLDVESKILLNKEVTNIDWSSDRLNISCADGSTYLADHVIVTASLGVLKDRHESLFTPRLPERKIKAIENIGFGTLGKIFLEFEEPFWLLNNSEFSRYVFLWEDEDLKELEGSDKFWLLNLIGFNKIEGFPNVLEGFIGGNNMKTFESLSDDKLTSDSLWLLEKFLDKKLPRLVSMKRTRWLTNRNFMGTYSYLSMNSEWEEVNPKDLAEPLRNSDNKPLVLFAGEATHEKYSSYSHGAVDSGWRAAKELSNYLKSKTDSA